MKTNDDMKKPIMTRICKVFGLGAMLLAGISSVSADFSDRKNVIFIFTDDQNYNWIGYKNPWAVTPNLDRLAEQGMIFEQGLITLPVCSPARAAALTGRHNLANGVTEFRIRMNAGEVSFAEYFNEAGYLTGLIGKWHIPWMGASGAGFQEVHELGKHEGYNTPHYFNPMVIVNGVEKMYEGFEGDFCVDQTLYVIEKAREAGQPFALWVCPFTPHGHPAGRWFSDETRQIYREIDFTDYPIPGNVGADLDGKPPYLQTYRGRRQGQNQYNARGVLMQMTELDRALGRLFETLESQGLMESTYIVFMSDNGIFNGQHGLGSKGLLYDAVVRVPLFVAGPGISGGRRDRVTQVSNVDIAPTILDLAGLPIPERMHGLSIKPLLKDNIALEREFVFLELPTPNPSLETLPAFGLRSTRWKFIQTYENGLDEPLTFEELYDLKNDPYELRNVVVESEHQDLVEKLRAELERQRERFSH
jgi:arylsulfatase A-like enzyme